MRVCSRRRGRSGLATALAIATVIALPAAASADTPRLAACDDLLVTISPSGTAGEFTAASVTAQALVADVAGWESVTWSVPGTTDLRDVLVLSTDGTTRSLGAERNGTANDVLQLGFCGQLASPTDTGGGSSKAPDDAVVIDPEPAPQPDPEPSRSATGEESRTGGSAKQDGSPQDGSTQDGARTDEPADTGANRDTAPADAAGATSSDGQADAQTQVDEAPEPQPDAQLDDAPEEAEPTAQDDSRHRDDAPAGVVPSGAGAGPYHDAARIAEVLTTSPHADGAVPDVTLVTARAEGTVAAKPPSGTDGLVAIVAALLAGALVGGALLAVRRHVAGQEVAA